MIMINKNCKIDFEKWLISNNEIQDIKNKDLQMHHWLTFKGFGHLPFLLQQGCYIDFLNSKNFKGVPLFDYVFSIFFKLKLESQDHNKLVQLSIEKSNDIYNSVKL